MQDSLKNKLYDTARNVPTICTQCGADFSCKSGDEPGDCWCMTSPNMKLSYQLDGTCLCPNCLADGQLNALTSARVDKLEKRAKQRMVNKDSRQSTDE